MHRPKRHGALWVLPVIFISWRRTKVPEGVQNTACVQRSQLLHSILRQRTCWSNTGWWPCNGSNSKKLSRCEKYSESSPKKHTDKWCFAANMHSHASQCFNSLYCAIPMWCGGHFPCVTATISGRYGCCWWTNCMKKKSNSRKRVSNN